MDRPSNVEVLEWARARWPERCGLGDRAKKLAEEAGEVMGAVVRIEEGRGSKEHLAQELARLVMCIKGVAAAADIDVDAAVEAEWAEMQTRQWAGVTVVEPAAVRVVYKGWRDRYPRAVERSHTTTDPQRRVGSITHGGPDQWGCGHCRGTGEFTPSHSTDVEPCPQCNGEGWYVYGP